MVDDHEAVSPSFFSSKSKLLHCGLAIQMGKGQLLLSRGLTVCEKTPSGSFRIFKASKYCEKTPFSLCEQVVWEQGYVCVGISHRCMCGYISLMGFLSRLRAMAVIRRFPGLFP